MDRRFGSRTWAAGAALAFAAALGCEGEAPQNTAPKPAEVQAAPLFTDQVADYEVFTGRVQTTHYLDIKARVTGYLKEVHFKEGEDVHGPIRDSTGKVVREGDVLFRIDSRPYDATLAQATALVDQANATVNQSRTRLQTAQDTLQRDKASPVATSQAAQVQDQDAVEEAVAALKAADAALKAAEAARQAAQNNVDYCLIRAPFDGRMGRLGVDLENDVIADNTVLASLVRLDPLYAYFDVDERTLLDLGIPQGVVTPEAVKNFPLRLGLANEDPEKFTRVGELKIADNKVDASTGTLRMWGTFPNADHDLKPGLFVRVRMDKGQAKPALFVAEAALGSDQGFKYLYVVKEGTNKDGKKVQTAVYTRVELGQRKDGRIAVQAAKGYQLNAGDTIVVDGLQRIHTVPDEKTGQPKPAEIQPTFLMEMPQAKAPDEDEGAGKKE